VGFIFFRNKVVPGQSITRGRWSVIFENEHASCELADAYTKKTAQCHHTRGEAERGPVSGHRASRRCHPHVNTSKGNPTSGAPSNIFTDNCQHGGNPYVYSLIGTHLPITF
jgi:hypothetical protein